MWFFIQGYLKPFFRSDPYIRESMFHFVLSQKCMFGKFSSTNENQTNHVLLQKSLIETFGLRFVLIRSRLKESKPSATCTDATPWMTTWNKIKALFINMTNTMFVFFGALFTYLLTSLVMFAAIRGENVSHLWLSNTNSSFSASDFGNGRTILSQRSPRAKIWRPPERTSDS